MRTCTMERDGSNATTGRAQVGAHATAMGRHGLAAGGWKFAFFPKLHRFFLTVVGNKYGAMRFCYFIRNAHSPLHSVAGTPFTLALTLAHPDVNFFS